MMELNGRFVVKVFTYLTNRSFLGRTTAASMQLWAHASNNFSAQDERDGAFRTVSMSKRIHQRSFVMESKSIVCYFHDIEDLEKS